MVQQNQQAEAAEAATNLLKKQVFFDGCELVGSETASQQLSDQLPRLVWSKVITRSESQSLKLEQGVQPNDLQRHSQKPMEVQPNLKVEKLENDEENNRQEVQQNLQAPINQSQSSTTLNNLNNLQHQSMELPPPYRSFGQTISNYYFNSASSTSSFQFYNQVTLPPNNHNHDNNNNNQNSIRDDQYNRTFTTVSSPVSIAHLNPNFYICEADGVIREYDHRARYRELMLRPYPKGGLLPRRINACHRNNCLLIVDCVASVVYRVAPNGRVEDEIGPRFSINYSLHNPEDAISDGDLMYIACPIIGIFIYSMDFNCPLKAT